MLDLRRPLALGLLAAVTTASIPASAQVGLPPPPGVDPYYYNNGYNNGYAPPPQTRFANPVALGLGVSMLVIGAGMLAGGFAVLAVKDSNPAVSGALLSVGGTMFAGGIPLTIFGAQQVSVQPGGPMMSRRRFIGAPRLLFPNAREGRPAGLAWSWQF
ncbi:MAG: hypothetical protein QM820_44760 [Minicystis sp.]